MTKEIKRVGVFQCPTCSWTENGSLCTRTEVYYVLVPVLQCKFSSCSPQNWITKQIKGEGGWHPNEPTNPKTPRARDIKGRLNGRLEKDLVHPYIHVSPHFPVNYWAGRRTLPLSLALCELLMHGAVQWPHLERAAPPLMPGLKCGLALLSGRHAHKQVYVHVCPKSSRDALTTPQ